MTQPPIDPHTDYIPPYQDSNRLSRAFRLLLLVVFFALGYRYFIWRYEVLNHEEWLLSYALFGAEIYICALSLIFVVATWNIMPKRRPKAPKGLKIDLLIPTYQESVDIVRRTVVAALNTKYPHETWLLDDSNRPEMKALAKELGCRYLARTKNIDAKAGNLNNALPHCTGDYVAVMDADHVMEPYFFEKMLGYFDDSNIAFVQSPQDYFNLNSFEHFQDKKKGNRPQEIIWGDQDLFFRVIDPGRDYSNGMHACGSSFVIRRKCLDEIGGFPPETATEDFHLSVKLHKRGYRAIYHNEPLAFGIGAGQYDVFVRQRFRWQHGNLHACRAEGIPFCKGLTLRQRICYSTVAFSALLGWSRVIFYCTPILVLLFGMFPIIATSAEHAANALPFLLFAYLFYYEYSHGRGRLIPSEHYAMSTFYCYCLAAFGIVFTKSKFVVTPKNLAGKFPVTDLLPQMAICVLSFVGAVLGIADTLLGDTAGGTIVPLVTFWAIWNTYLSGRVIKSALDCENNSDDFYQFEVPLPIEIGSGKNSQITHIRDISTQKMVIKQGTATLTENQSIKGSIFLPSGDIPFTGKVAKLFAAHKEPLAEIALSWKNTPDKDQLDQILHQCTWHRFWLGQRPFVKTLFYGIDHLIRLCRGNPLYYPKWELVPYRVGKDKRTYIALRDAKKKESDELLLFGQDVPKEKNAHQR